MEAKRVSLDQDKMNNMLTMLTHPNQGHDPKQ